MKLREANWTLSLSPYGRISEVPAFEVFQTCLYVMHRWGFIKCFRFDNGRPFGSPDLDTVTPAAFVLAALGCRLIFNKPRSPTQNAKVERNQGTTSRWAPAGNCADLATFQQALDEAVIIQRERYKTRVCQGQTRLAAFPKLASNTRRYDARSFCLRKAYVYLGRFTFVRRVAAHGQIGLLGKRYQVGGHNRGKQVRIGLITKMGKPVWIVSDAAGQILERLVARHLADGEFIATVWRPS